MNRQPSHWVWLAPIAVSLLAGWLTLHGPASEPAPAPSLSPAPTASAYPAPNVDPSEPPADPAPTF